MCQKTIVSLIAASMLVAACGGGGGDETVSIASSSPATSEATPAAQTPATTSAATQPASGTPTTAPTGTGSPPPAATDSGTGSTGAVTPAKPVDSPTPPGGTTTAPVVDQRFKGHLQMVSNQILYLRVNRFLYLPQTLGTFESATGIVDVASGSKIARVPNLEADAAKDGCTIAVDGTCAIQPPAVAPAAPIAAFGIRVGTHLLPSEPGQSVGNQTVVARIAFDLTERTDSPGVGTNSTEVMRFVIDNVEMATNADGVLSTVRLRDGARIHVYGRNAAGVEVRESIPAPARTVRLLPLIEIPDSKGDTTSTILFMDLETGFSQAGDRLAALHDIAGHFTMHVTLSSVGKIERPAAVESPGFPAVSLRDLIGESITVNAQTPVTGGGISGSAWIRMYPM